MKKLLFAIATATVASSSFAWTLDKTADLGPFWNPLGASPNTSIYADSFVFNGATGENLSQLGIHLLNTGAGHGQDLKYFLLADGGNAPTSTILSTSTANVQTDSNTLTLLTANMSGFAMTNGTRYWVAAQGQGNDVGFYQVGGHTQNSVQNDNGTFWYSNNNDLNNWDGQGLTPEMAIYVHSDAVPEPMTMLVLGAGVLGVARRRRRQSK